MGSRHTKKYKYYIHEEVHHKHFVAREPPMNCFYESDPPLIAITRPAYHHNNGRQIIFL